MAMKVIAGILFFATLLCSAEEPKVTLHLLDHTRSEPTGKKFWIAWSKEWRGIEESKIIKGADAKEITDALRTSLKNTPSQHFCGHDPIYGIVAQNENGQTITTSLCFKCMTWVQPAGTKDRRLDIAGKLGANNPLCLMLRKHIELPEQLLRDKN